jgi:hypothetical protein
LCTDKVPRGISRKYRLRRQGAGNYKRAPAVDYSTNPLRCISAPCPERLKATAATGNQQLHALKSPISSAQTDLSWKNSRYGGPFHALPVSA